MLRILSIFILSIIFLSGCAIIDAILGERIKEPVVKVESVDFGSVSFESLELLFNIMIENPNQFGISLSSFDYELLLNEKSFVKGDQQKGMQIDANAALALDINNPNSFSLGLKNMQYAFTIDGIEVVEGARDSALSINRNDDSRIEIPVSIKFADFGQTIYRIFRGEQKAQFRFTGSAVFDSSLDFFQNIPLNFDTYGDLPLVR